MNTPMHPTIYLGLDEESMQVDGTQNRAMIRSLLYLTASRPDIMFSACLCEVFKKKPREVHLIVVKRIFRYLIGTPNGLYFKHKKEFKLISYCDVDYAGFKIERRSISGSCHLIGGNLVKWINKKQGSIAFSSTEVEYIYQ